MLYSSLDLSTQSMCYVTPKNTYFKHKIKFSFFFHPQSQSAMIPKKWRTNRREARSPSREPVFTQCTLVTMAVLWWAWLSDLVTCYWAPLVLSVIWQRSYKCIKSAVHCYSPFSQRLGATRIPWVSIPNLQSHCLLNILSLERLQVLKSI